MSLILWLNHMQPHYLLIVPQHSIPHSSNIITLLLLDLLQIEGLNLSSRLVYLINERWKKEGKMKIEEGTESLGLFVYLFQASTTAVYLLNFNYIFTLIINLSQSLIFSSETL